jgi:hypothetical protein
LLRFETDGDMVGVERGYIEAHLWIARPAPKVMKVAEAWLASGIFTRLLSVPRMSEPCHSVNSAMFGGLAHPLRFLQRVGIPILNTH